MDASSKAAKRRRISDAEAGIGRALAVQSRAPKPDKKGKGKAKNGAERHSWDCTGMVKRYTRIGDVPPELVKCA